VNTRTFVLALSVLATCAGKVDRLESYERDHFTALRVWMDKKQEKFYLKEKTPEARDQWLKDAKFWDLFYQYDETRRNAILAGDVETGWTQDQVEMSWGKPYQKKRLTGRAQRSYLYIYRFEIDKDGATMVWVPGSKSTYKAIGKYQVSLFVDDATVTEYHRKESWD
jgi:hypothetical protein